MRRAREEMDSAAYRDMTYYERWIASIETILIEKNILSKEEIDRKLAEFEAKWGELSVDLFFAEYILFKSDIFDAGGATLRNSNLR